MAVNLEMSVDFEAPNYLNVKKPTIKTAPSTDTQHRGAFRLAGVCIGVMCIVQATLNIVLRLFLTSPVAVEMLPKCNNQTLSTYTAQLQSRYDDLAKEKQRLTSNYNILRIMRDQLQVDKEKLQSKLSNIDEELKKLGWFSFTSSLYYMSTEEKDWRQSREDCKRRGAELVIIKSKEEQDFIEMLRRGKQAWIGLSDHDAEGMWKWVDGTQLVVAYWWNQEPNNYMGGEDCVMTGYIPDDGRLSLNVLDTWNDNACAVNSFWICEKKISV